MVSPLLDAVGFKRFYLLYGTLLSASCIGFVSAPMYLEGRILFLSLWFCSLLLGFSWALAESASNLGVSMTFRNEGVRRMNLLHAWFPVGTIIGACVAVGGTALSVGWRWVVLAPIVPATLLIVAAASKSFPATDRIAKKIALSTMLLEAVRRPSFLFWGLVMFATAGTEMSYLSYLDLLLTDVVGMRGILLVGYGAGVAFIARQFAGILASKLGGSGLLGTASLIAAIGIFLLSQSETPFGAMVAATIASSGIAYLWPTSIANCYQRYPTGGAWTAGLLGTIGCMAGYIVTPALGAMYDGARFAASSLGLEKAAVHAAREAFEVLSALPLAAAVLLAVYVFVLKSRSKQRRTPAMGNDA